MKRTTVKIADALDARLRHEAARRGMTISEISQAALEACLDAPRGRRRLGAAGAGRSGRDDVSERIEEILAAEVAYLLATRLGTEPEVRFLGDVASGAFAVEPVAAGDWLRIATLVARYRGLPLGTVDASVVAAAERLGVQEVATVDRRSFGVVRPAHVAAFALLP